MVAIVNLDDDIAQPQLGHLLKIREFLHLKGNIISFSTGHCGRWWEKVVDEESGKGREREEWWMRGGGRLRGGGGRKMELCPL
jgi:hypothetical protein